MSNAKKILIVESDSALVTKMRSTLEPKGFTVEDTSDGKGCVELTRKKQPDLVLLAVDLPAGQNGYILCGKFKKDDELKGTPVVIMGNPDGFAAHRKLKSRADDYVAKPIDMGGLLTTVGNLIGMPEVASEEVVSEEAAIDGLEEIAVEPQAEDTMGGDPALDMLDAAFDDISTPESKAAEAASKPAPRAASFDAEEPDEISGRHFRSVEEEAAVNAPTEDAFSSAPSHASDEPAAEPAPLRESRSYAVGPDAAEMRSLRAKVSELTASLEDAQAKAQAAQTNAQELQNSLHDKDTELETARQSSAAGGKSDKEFFALREAANKKDKDLLKIKGELNEKDQSLVELREREMELEQKLNEVTADLGKRDAQLKTATSKLEQTTSDRSSLEQQAEAAKQEARAATSQLTAVQQDLDGAHQHIVTVEQDLEKAREDAKKEASDLRGRLSEAQRTADNRGVEVTKLKDQLESAQQDLENTKAEASSTATAFAEEAERLRRRIGELEDQGHKHEERLAKLYQRIKSDEKLREKTKKAMAIATQLLEEQTVQVDEADEDESAASA